MFSLVQVKVKLHTFQIIIEIRNTVNEDLKEKYQPSILGKFDFFNFFTITRMSAIPGCPNIFWENGNISFTELKYSDLRQAIIFRASLPCSRSILASFKCSHVSEHHSFHTVVQLAVVLFSWRVVVLQCRRDHQRSGNICSLYSFYIFQISHHTPIPPLSPSPIFPLAQKRSFFVPVLITFKLHEFRTTKTNCQHKWLTNSPPGRGQNGCRYYPHPSLFK